MAKNVEFDMSELEDYAEVMLEFIETDFPKECEKFMKSEAKKLRNKAKKDGAGKVGVKTGNYLKGFKAGKKVYEYGDAKFNVRVYNSAPHAHLIEYGHNMVSHNGSVVGFVPGFHVLENATLAYQDKFARNIEEKLVAKAEEKLGK